MSHPEVLEPFWMQPHFLDTFYSLFIQGFILSLMQLAFCSGAAFQGPALDDAWSGVDFEFSQPKLISLHGVQIRLDQIRCLAYPFLRPTCCPLYQLTLGLFPILQDSKV